MPMNNNQPYVIDYIGVIRKPDPAKTAEEYEYVKKTIMQFVRKQAIKEIAKEYEL
jgi:hypothetical protein